MRGKRREPTEGCRISDSPVGICDADSSLEDPLICRLPRAVECAVVAMQLGRPLIGRLVGVPKLCSYGQPQVVSTYPVMWEGNGDDVPGEHGPGAAGSKGIAKPFPTIYWLTCPHVREAVSALESEGMIGDVTERIECDEKFRRAYELANVGYARKRMALISCEDLERLEGEAPKILRVLRETGIGGVARPFGVKCLHMQIADSMVGNINPVGKMTISRLAEAGARLECDNGRCVPLRVAAVNAGSNSAKVLVADVVPQPPAGAGAGLHSHVGGARGLSDMSRAPRIFRVGTEIRVTGLGHGLGKAGRLSEPGREATVDAICNFVELGRGLGAKKIWVTATAAARAAEDSQLLTDQVQEACGVRLEIISSKLEAELSFLGVLASAGAGAVAVGNESLFSAAVVDPWDVMVMDSGGMSTEFMRLDSRTGEVSSISLPLGAVTLTDQFLLSDPPLQEEIDRMRQHIKVCLEEACTFVQSSAASSNAERSSCGRRVPAAIVSVGGSAVTLASISLGVESFKPDLVHGHVIHRDDLEKISASLCSVACAERMKMRGMIQPERARVMPAGAAIILEAMELFGATEVVASVAGILDGMASCIGLGKRGHEIWRPESGS